MLQEDPQGSFNDTFGSWGMKTLILLNVQQLTYYPMYRKYRFAFSNTLFEKVRNHNQQVSQMNCHKDVHLVPSFLNAEGKCFT